MNDDPLLSSVPALCGLGVAVGWWCHEPERRPAEPGNVPRFWWGGEDGFVAAVGLALLFWLTTPPVPRPADSPPVPRDLAQYLAPLVLAAGWLLSKCPGPAQLIPFAGLCVVAGAIAGRWSQPWVQPALALFAGVSIGVTASGSLQRDGSWRRWRWTAENAIDDRSASPRERRSMRLIGAIWIGLFVAWVGFLALNHSAGVYGRFVASLPAAIPPKYSVSRIVTGRLLRENGPELFLLVGSIAGVAAALHGSGAGARGAVPEPAVEGAE